MRVTVGTKATNPLPDGRMYPAIAVSEPYTEEVSILDKLTKKIVQIIVTRADFVSQRTNLAGEVFLHFGPEVITYGRKAVAIPRFDYVTGLDVDEDDNRISLDTLMKNYQTAHSAYLAQGFETRKGVVAAEDL